jgi:hypothetical protein
MKAAAVPARDQASKEHSFNVCALKHNAVDIMRLLVRHLHISGLKCWSFGKERVAAYVVHSVNIDARAKTNEFYQYLPWLRLPSTDIFKSEKIIVPPQPAAG